MHVYISLLAKTGTLNLPSQHHTDNLLQAFPMNQYKHRIGNAIYCHAEETVKHPAADDENPTHQQILQHIYLKIQPKILCHDTLPTLTGKHKPEQ